MKRQSPTNSSGSGDCRHGGRSGQSRQGFRGGRLTKLAGMVASFAPAVSGGAKAFLLSTASLVGVLAGAFLGLTANDARAACTEAPTGTWTCTGASSERLQITRSGALAINLADDFTVTTSSQEAFLIGKLGAGDISLTQSAGGGEIRGATTGIFLHVINGSASTSINVSGTVTGVSTYGVGVTNTGSAGSHISIAGVGFSGGKRGIHAETGSGSVSISASGTVTGVSDDGIYAKTKASSAGSLSVTAATVTGGKVGIRAVASGAGAVSIKAGGAVTGTAEAGIKVNSFASATDMTIDAAAVTGNAGIDARHGGSGKLDIKATGSVSGTGAEGIFGLVSNSSGGPLTITAAAVTGSSYGIRAMSSGTGDVSISATGSVSGTGADGIFGLVSNASGGTLTITAAAVTGSSYGIRGQSFSTGDVSISVSGTVTGGAGTYDAAIRALNASGRNVTISLSSGASVGASGRNAIIDSVGNATVTVNTGASITGKVGLGAGNDTLAFAGGTFSGVTEMDGGAGTDTLTFSNASGSVSGTVANWEEVKIESGATISFGTGSHTVTAGTLTVATGGMLDVGDDSDTGDRLTVSGAFAGGGTVILNANFGSTSSGADILAISGNVTGATTVNLSRIGTGAITTSNAARIDGVISATGTLVAGAFRIGSISGLQNSVYTYRLEFNSVAKRFDLVRTFANACAETGTSGAFTCSGSNQIGASQSLSASGATALSVTLNSETPIDTGGAAFTLTQTGGSGGISLTQSGSGERIRGAQSGIVASNSGGGAISIDVNGTVTGAAGDGISASSDASGSGITITAASVSGANTGIKALEGGSGAVSIIATGTVTGASEEGVYAKAASGGAITVTAATVTGGKVGIRAVASGAGAVSVRASGAVSATAANGIGIDASASGGAVTVSAAAVTGTATGIKVVATGAGSVSISASGAVTGTGGDGIFVDHDGTGATTIAVSSAATGGTGTGVAAIRTDVGTGRRVTVTLNSGASVGTTTGAPNAIVDTAGDATVTVNTGATIAGKVDLGAGNDTLAFAGGAFSNVTEMQGGAGIDTLRFSGGAGSLHATVQSQGLEGWESVVIQSGATLNGNIKLANDSDNLTFDRTGIAGVDTLAADGGNNANTLSFNGVSGSLVGKALTGWETVGVGAGSTIRFADGTHTLQAGLSVASGGTLDVGDDSDTGDTLTVSGNFAGGGTVILNANFGSSSSGADILVISGNVTGATTVNLSRIGSGDITTANSAAKIDGVISVTGTVDRDAFTLGATGIGQSSAFIYELQFNAANKRFDLVRVSSNACEAAAGASGAFTCSGANQIGASQTLSASGAANLSVTLNSETPVSAAGTAFALTQTGGSGGISFTQSATGSAVSAAAGGIVARNEGGGAISINVNGTVTGASGDGISAANDASGSGITITAAAVSGSESGIRAVEDGSGAVRIMATGTVTGASEDGVYAKTGSGGAITVTAAAVAGGKAGIRASAGGAGAVSVRAAGSVTAGEHGISVRRGGAGRVDIAVSSAVAGGSGAAHAAIATDAPGGSAVRIALNSGASAVGAGDSHAIMGGAGDSEVTVAAGAAITGRVSLGSGTDTLAFAGGSFDAVTRMDGGDGPGDTLRFGGGSGSLNDAIAGSSGEGLKGWESVVIESGATLSGAIRLADDSGNLTFDGAAIGGVTALDGGGGSANTLSFNGVSGALAASAMTGWEDVVIGAGSRVRLTGSNLPRTAAARLSVTGTLAFGTTTAATDAFTVQGDFAGGGMVAIDANFSAPENGAPTADRLVIEGSATGTTAIAINDLTPADGAIPGGDIEVVSVEGGAAASAFTLANAVAHGAHVYGLAHVPDDTGDGAKFVLRPGSGASDSGAVLRLAPAAIAAGIARSAALAARSAARMPGAAGSGIGAPATLTERLKELIGQDSAGMGADGGGARSLWARFHSDSQSSDAADGFGESEIDSAGVVFGADLLSGEAAGGMWIAGLTAQYGSVSAEARGAGGVGRQEATGYGLGAAATWFGTGGLYADAAAQFGSFEADYSADSTGVIKNGVGGGTSSAALELGRRFAAGDSMTLAPRGRLGWSSVSSDKFTSEDGVEIDLGTSSVMEASVGVAAEFGLSKGGVRVSGTLSRRLGDPDGVAVGGQTVAQAGPDGWMELGFGGTFDVDADSVLFLDGAYRAGGDSTGLSLSGGLKFNW